MSAAPGAFPHYIGDYEHALRDIADKAILNATAFRAMGTPAPLQADAWDAVARTINEAADKLNRLLGGVA